MYNPHKMAGLGNERQNALRPVHKMRNEMKGRKDPIEKQNGFHLQKRLRYIFDMSNENKEAGVTVTNWEGEPLRLHTARQIREEEILHKGQNLPAVKINEIPYIVKTKRKKKVQYDSADSPGEVDSWGTPGSLYSVISNDIPSTIMTPSGFDSFKHSSSF